MAPQLPQPDYSSVSSLFFAGLVGVARLSLLVGAAYFGILYGTPYLLRAFRKWVADEKLIAAGTHYRHRKTGQVRAYSPRTLARRRARAARR